MKRHIVFWLSFALAVSLLFGCMGPIAPSPEPPAPGEPDSIDYSLVGTANYVPLQPEEDPYPLFVGARWIYRNAAVYWNPQISLSGLLESEVVAIVQGRGEQCYVLQTHYSNGPDELLYIHRTGREVMVRGSRWVAAPGAQPSFSLNPGLAFLKLPLQEDQTWEEPFRGGSVNARVFHREIVAIESGKVLTLLGDHPAIFSGAWRVHYDLFGSGPRLFGGPQQFLWFAPGIGVVKHVLNSVNYELAEFRKRNEVASLEEQDAETVAQIPSGGLVLVQLRGPSPDAEGPVWRMEESLEGNGVIELIDRDFYYDLDTASDAGTVVYRFRALAPGEVKLRFGGLNDLEYTVRVL